MSVAGACLRRQTARDVEPDGSRVRHAKVVRPATSASANRQDADKSVPDALRHRLDKCELFLIDRDAEPRTLVRPHLSVSEIEKSGR